MLFIQIFQLEPVSLEHFLFGSFSSVFKMILTTSRKKVFRNENFQGYRFFSRPKGLRVNIHCLQFSPRSRFSSRLMLDILLMKQSIKPKKALIISNWESNCYHKIFMSLCLLLAILLITIHVRMSTLNVWLNESPLCLIHQCLILIKIQWETSSSL